jgi:hypothetical protein
LPDAALIETGPRAVLYNLLRQRWLGVARFKVDLGGDEFVETISLLRSYA